MALPLRDDSPTRQIPIMTLGLLVANVVVFLFLQPAALQDPGKTDHGEFTDQQRNEVSDFSYQWGVVPCEIEHNKALSEGVRCSGAPATAAPPDAPKVVLLSLLTHMFIHGSLLHLAGNMLFLWVFGAAVEDRLGPVPFLLVYLATGLVAILGHVAIYLGDAVPALGASGAIAGIMGAYLVFRPRGRVLSLVLWTVVYVPAWVVLGLFFATQFLTPDAASVAWEAHAIGMAAGFGLALILARFFKDPFAPPPTLPSAPRASDWVMPSTPPS